jgi:polysaccharide export outer membrane protein
MMFKENGLTVMTEPHHIFQYADFKEPPMKKLKVLFYSTIILFACFCGQGAAQGLLYAIGPGDIVEISVWKDESLSRTIVVPPDGIISFPLIGDIQTQYMTVDNLRKKVSQLLAAYVPDATVTVILKELNSLKAYVIGKVNKPGQYAISLDTTVMQILSIAGGLTPYASENTIHILRRKKNITIKIPFNYSQVLKGNNLEQNIVLQRGDVVVVP